ncbi:response regulator, partial [Arthrospira platensis SPKY1]|nr:response regulator [Arthrospira platensis SPKY1]
MNKPIKVLVVDDSAVVRQVISAVLADASGIEVMGTASDPVFALDKMRREWPDVITLDVEMPRMDGISFLRQVMAERPTPVVICSSLTTRGAQATLQALAAGAVSVIAKPTVGVKNFLSDSAAELVQAVRGAAKARPRSSPSANGTPVVIPSVTKLQTEAMAQTTDRIIAIGTSTGGTQALEHVIRSLP